MAENSEKSSRESVMEKISDKIHGRGSLSAESESEAGKPLSPPSSMRSKFNRLFGREKPVHKVLGGGKAADVFLWRNKKISAGLLGGVTAVWVLFELIEYHFLTLVCHVLIAAISIVFLWANATAVINKSPPPIPEYQINEEHFHQVISALRSDLNRGLALLHEIACGREVKKFLGVIAGLWVLSVAGSWFNFLTLFYITFVLLHTVPVLYEKYEDQVDSYAEKAMIEFKKLYSVFDAKVLSKIPRGPSKNKKKN
ncbi:unnamed protein product [Rhodiola kirilowii]